MTDIERIEKLEKKAKVASNFLEALAGVNLIVGLLLAGLIGGVRGTFLDILPVFGINFSTDFGSLLGVAFLYEAVLGFAVLRGFSVIIDILVEIQSGTMRLKVLRQSEAESKFQKKE